MSKRSALIEPLEAAHPTKRPHIDAIDSPCPIIDNGDDDVTTIQTPSSFADDVESPITAATTPRAKFPSDLKTLPCTWPGCPKTFNRPARLRDHLNSHTNSRPFKCTYQGCDKDYIEDKHLKQHIKAVHTNERKHVCQRPGCGKSFVTGTRLKRHQAVHEGADRFRCPDCGQSFRKRETLHKHVLKDHKGEPPHQCAEPGCGAKFDSKGALRRHHQKLHGEPRFWCTDCAAQTAAAAAAAAAAPDGTARQAGGFTTLALLEAHIKQEHQGCYFCDFKSSSQSEMAAHVDVHHSGKTVADRRTFACEHAGCVKRFTKRSNLRAHVRTAHEGFRFVCGEVDLGGAAGLAAWSNELGCGDKFCTKVRLEDHVRYIHLRQDRPRATTAAAATIKRQSSSAAAAAAAAAAVSSADIIDELSGLHMQAKKTIPCAYCPEAFARYFDLAAHVEVAHGAAGAPAEDDGGLFSIENGEHKPFGAGAGMFGGGEEEEEIFAAEMHDEPLRDEWLDDEAGIMMLARDSPLRDAYIDPSLGNI